MPPAGRTLDDHSLKEPSTALGRARQASEEKWLADLASLLKDAEKLFADILWVSNDGERVASHKSIIYARCSGTFQHRYLLAPLSAAHNDSTLSIPFQGSQRSLTPTSGLRDIPDQFPRSPSPASIRTVTPAALVPLPLGDTDISVFRACLEHFYSGSKTAESFSVLFEGFEEGVREGEPELKGVQKLRQDMLYTWRSKLYADMTLALDDGTVFATHRAILAARSPYFRTLLSGEYNDAQRTHFTLPSPPFTSSSTTFVLGYCYTGTLEFGNRSFDLSTAIEIWRAASYLSISLLQEEVETKIESMLNLARAARIYSFALAPDVNSQRLARAASPLIIGQFYDTWNAPQIGNLDYNAQRKLVSSVCETISPLTVTAIGKGSFGLRKRLELDRASWAEHVRAMLDAIDERIKAQLAKNLAQVVISPGFVGLVDGQGFSTDVLEWLVSELVVSSLTEAKAPETYQTLVGSVLLREEGILMDAKVIVEDAKNGILNYIKRRWPSIVAAKGFDGLESWCLKELSGELDLPISDLLTPLPKSSAGAARLTSRPPSKPSSLPAARRATPSTSTVASRPTSRPTTPAATPSAAPAAPTRTTRLSTTSTLSTTSRPVLASSNTTPSSSTSAVRAATPSSTISAAARGGSASARGRVVVASTRAGAGSVRPTTRSDVSLSLRPPPPPAHPNLARNLASTNLSSVPAPPSPPKPSRALPSPPSQSSAFPSDTLAPPPPPPGRLTPNGSTPRIRPGPSPTRRPPSLAPSDRSVASTSTATVVKAKRNIASSRTPIPSPKTPTAPTSTVPTSSSRSAMPGGTDARKENETSKGSVADKEAVKTTSSTSTAPASAATPAKVVVKRPSSITSTKSTAERLRRPSSATSIRSVTSVRASPAAAPSLKKHTSAGSLKAVTPKASSRSLKSSATPPIPRIPLAEKTSSSANPTSPSSESKGLPGTTLLSGIPCIVTVGQDKVTRFRASVRYLGGVLWAPGQWVGIEVAESAIPDEARDLPWNQGSVEGRQYFEIKPPEPQPLNGNGRVTPLVGELPDGRSAGSSGASSLRPPSRRQRRSSSSDAAENGPRRGLFVKPNQIVYVL